MGFRSLRAIACLTLFTLGIPAVTGSPAEASAPKACDTSWKAAIDGNWADASRWTNGVPDGTATSAACITKNGTYTVHVTGGAFPRALTVGAAHGHQTVSIEASCDSPAGIDIGESSYPDEFGTIGANATVRLSDTGCDGEASLEEEHGTLTNAGTIDVAASATASRLIMAIINNEGTLRLGAGSDTHLEGGIVDAPGSTTEIHLGAAGGGFIGDSEPGIQLDGTLAIVVDPGFVPVDGYHFSACTNCPGHFAHITGQTLADGFVVHRHYHLAPDGYPAVELKIRHTA